MTISAISVYVPDLTLATEFYTKCLGFRVAQSFDDYAVKLEGDGPSLLLCAGGSPSPARYPSGVVLGHRTADVNARVAALQKTPGVAILHDEPQPFPAGRYVAFTDPFGVSHELLEYAR